MYNSSLMGVCLYQTLFRLSYGITIEIFLFFVFQFFLAANVLNVVRDVVGVVSIAYLGCKRNVIGVAKVA